LFEKMKKTAKRKSLHFEKEEILDLEVPEDMDGDLSLSPAGDPSGRLPSYFTSGELKPFTIVDYFFAVPDVENSKDKESLKSEGKQKSYGDDGQSCCVQ
jgi:hypothetical protein